MYKQAPKSPAMKALVGNQKNLPAGLKAQIEAAPESPAKMDIGPEKPKSSAPAIKKANKTHSFVKTKTKERIKEEKINLPAKAKKLTSKSPAKSLEIVLKKKKDGTLNEKYLKTEQDESNSKAVKKSLATNFGVKKPKANIK